MPESFALNTVLLSLPQQSLHGRLVSLEPLSQSHANELLPIVSNKAIWQFLTTDASTKVSLDAYIAEALKDRDEGTAAPYVVRCLEMASLVGCTRLKDYSKKHRRVTIGSWFVPAVWGKGPNIESKFLLLTLAFEQIHCERVEFHTDSRNLRSRAALNALGAVEEGVLRSYAETRYGDGCRRDDVVFGLLRGEWSATKQHLLGRLEAILQAGYSGNAKTDPSKKAGERGGYNEETDVYL